MEDESALATVVDDAPRTPLTPPEDDEDDGVHAFFVPEAAGFGDEDDEDGDPAPLLDKKSLDCLISGTVRARRALADFLAIEEGYYLAPRDRAAIDAADRIIQRVLRQSREDYSLA